MLAREPIKDPRFLLPANAKSAMPKRPTLMPRPVDDREKAWLNLRPLTAEKRPITQQGFVAPLGALEGIDHFIARVEAIQRLATQQERDAASHRILVEQDKELPTIVDEFRANGFQAVSMSSSSRDENDDDQMAANLAQKHLGLVPYEPDPETLAPLMRRIEWEKSDSKNGPTVTVELCLDADGNISATLGKPWMTRLVTTEDIRVLGKKVKAACSDLTYQELEDNRARVRFYGLRAKDVYPVHREVIEEQSFDDLGQEEHEKFEEDDDNPRAPQELLLHSMSSDDPETWGPIVIVLPEPSESEIGDAGFEF